MDLSAARTLFVEEAKELLSEMEVALLEIESEGRTPERINAVFRAAHTIKGSAGLFGLELIVSFSHLMESVLDLVRKNSLPLSAEILNVILRCGDYLKKMVESVDTEHENEDPAPEERSNLMGRLQDYLGNYSKNLPAEKPDTLKEENNKETISNNCWHISVRLSPDTTKNGMDPLSLIQYLKTFGKISYIYTVTDEIPTIENMDPEACYLGFEMDIETDVDKKVLESAFEFVREGSRIRILPPRAKISEYIDLIKEIPESSQKLGEILVSGGTLTQTELVEILEIQKKSSETSGDKVRIGELLIQEQVVQPPVVAAALSKQKQVTEKRSNEQRFIKVETGKLDVLIDLVGELVVACAGSRLQAHKTQQRALVESIEEVGKLVEQIRDNALTLRMIPIGDVFQRFPRIVRDMSVELGKQMDLVITGAETELDKAMVEKLTDPLLHIVRNSIDHGMDSVEERVALGKPPSGELHLHAYHESGCIIIEVRDNGRGINTEKILSKAIEAGLIPPDAQLSENEIHRLIFQAGFSTAEKITNLSGRGVGMDVVKQNIEALHGEIEIESKKNEGTLIRLRIPLTLAIIDGFQVAVENSTFVVPLEMIVECADMKKTSGSQRIVNLRNEALPFVRLREFFKIPERDGPIQTRESLVVVEYAHKRFGIAVDRLLGEFQAVIKPLSRLCNGTQGIGGSTILGDGSVALILDIPQLIEEGSKRNGESATNHFRNGSYFV